MRLPRLAAVHQRLALFWIAAGLGIAAPWLTSCDPLRVFPERAGNARTCTVASVHDGDTLRATCDGERLQVRLYCIDAPELDQAPWGRESYARLEADAKAQGLGIWEKPGGQQTPWAYPPPRPLGVCPTCPIPAGKSPNTGQKTTETDAIRGSWSFRLVPNR